MKSWDLTNAKILNLKGDRLFFFFFPMWFIQCYFKNIYWVLVHYGACVYEQCLCMTGCSSCSM